MFGCSLMDFGFLEMPGEKPQPVLVESWARAPALLEGRCEQAEKNRREQLRFCIDLRPQEVALR